MQGTFQGGTNVRRNTIWDRKHIIYVGWSSQNTWIELWVATTAGTLGHCY